MTPAERATRERLAQGLGEHVEDERVLDQVAGLLRGTGDDDAGPHQQTRRRTGRSSPGRSNRTSSRAEA
jgi:hypothetical protein